MQDPLRRVLHPFERRRVLEKILKLLSSLYLVYLLFSPLNSKELSKQAGSLLVTYHTGQHGERLDRVRFWLKDEHGLIQMYPKGERFVEDPSTHMRMVAIGDLAPGVYYVQFVFPNADGLFEIPIEHQIVVTAGRITKLDQYIKPHYSRLIAQSTLFGVEKTPSSTITLKNKEGTTIAQTKMGKLEVKNLKPGQYILYFEPIEGYSTPSPVEITLITNETKGPIEGIYKPIQK